MGKLSKFLFFTLVCIFLVNSCIVFAAGSFSPKLVINIVDANGNKDKSLDGGEHYISLLLDSYIEEEYQFTYETESGSENASFSQDGAQIDIPIELVDGTASINFYDLPDGGDELFMYVFNSQIDTGEEIYQVQSTKTIDGATEENYSGVASFQAGSDVLIEFDYTNDKALEAPAENGTGDSEGLGEDNSDTIDNGEKTNSNDMGSSSAGVRQESMTSPDLAQDTYDEPALAEEEVDYVNPFAGIADEVADTEKNDGEISQGPVEIYIEKLDGYFIAEYDNENQYYEVFDDAGVAIGYTGSIEGPISITYFDTENAEKENPSTFDLNIMLPPLLAMCVAVYGLIKVRRGIFSR